MRCDFFFLYIKHCPRTRISMNICRQPQTKNWRGDERSQKYTVLKVSPTSHISTIWRLTTVLYRHLVPKGEHRKGRVNMPLTLSSRHRDVYLGQKFCKWENTEPDRFYKQATSEGSQQVLKSTFKDLNPQDRVGSG